MAATNEQQSRPLTQTMGGDPAYQKTVMQTMMRALGDSNVKLELGEDDTLKTTYKPMLENIQAQTQATEQAGLPSYEGIDPQLVLGLMKQRAVQDQQFRRQPMDMNEMLYRNRVGAAQNPLYNIFNTAQKQAGMDRRQETSDRMATGRQYIKDEAAGGRNKAQIAGREKVANIYAEARSKAGGKQPSLLDLTDALNVSMFDKKGMYTPPAPGEIDVLDGLFRQQGYKLVSLPLGPYKPWLSGNQPAQNAYFLTRKGQNPSQNTILQQLARMGYKGLTAENIPELTGAR
jgi:hypothetical protein